MKDRLEEFIHQNRDAFDVHEPDPSLWLGIQAAKPEQKTLRFTWVRYAAAVAVIFAGVSAGIFFLSNKNVGEEVVLAELAEEPELMEAEMYYNKVIEEKYNELKPYFASLPEMKEEVEMDFDELDNMYRDIKKDLNDEVGNPEVIEALIQNYRMKVEILEELLDQIKEKENLNYEEREEISL